MQQTSVQESEGKLSPFLGVQRYKNVVRFIAENDVVLDIGSGSGLLKSYLPKSTKYYGVDSAKQWAGNPKHLFKVGVGKDLPKELRDKNFTVVTALALIEHLKEPGTLFKDASKVLQKGGRLVLTTPHPIGEKVHTFGAKTGLFSSHAHDEHEDLLDKTALSELANQNGFKMMEYKRFLFGMNQVAVFIKQ